MGFPRKSDDICIPCCARVCKNFCKMASMVIIHSCHPYQFLEICIPICNDLIRPIQKGHLNNLTDTLQVPSPVHLLEPVIGQTVKSSVLWFGLLESWFSFQWARWICPIAGWQDPKRGLLRKFKNTERYMDIECSFWMLRQPAFGKLMV